MFYPWQQIQWQQINQLINTERLPHALFLHGNEGLGKTNFAISLANALLCKQPTETNQACGVCQACQLLAANTHPDLYYLKPVPAENTKSKKPALNIRIDDVRGLCNKLNQTSQYGGYRVAILQQADQLTLSAANSLLKTLEEPGKDVLIILTSARSHRLPVTIRSRCQLLRFTVPDEAQALSWLKENQQDANVTEKQLAQALSYAFGSPLLALNNLQKVEQQQLLAEAMTAKVSGKNSILYAAKLAKFNKVQVLEGMLSWALDLSKLLACGSEINITNEQSRDKLKTLAKGVNSQHLFRFYDQLNFNVLHTSIAVNEQLLWENLLLSWDDL
ncbi:DNA polymerase III delta prime subunit [hydrothermal vent metagenome]|uniref:DNA polymerase III subunit delta' n=1 Tax=hydrothermal vent metagenome TaxID=652676 RepID=A0A3B0WC86_9ZZZZ